MFAVIKTGGKQYRVAKDNVLAVEKLGGEAGETVVFDQVLMLGEEIGKPVIDGAQVVGTVVRQFRDETKIIFKKRRRKHYRRRNGHRQHLTLVKITDMGKGIAAAPAKAAAKPAAKKATKKAAAESAAA
ncbi:MAG: 50S ribosomal protein L21 [Rhodospirillaceae bacterium]|nr:50S ribosomal protein L21 [Rhodospirillaceae bacterium]